MKIQKLRLISVLMCLFTLVALPVVMSRATATVPLVNEIMSADSSGNNANADSTGLYGLPTISGDGRYAVFASSATNLVAGDTNGVNDIFVKDRTTGTVVRASLTSTGAELTSLSERPTISYNGTFVTFTSKAPNLPGATGTYHTYRRNLTTGTTELVSSNASGTPATYSSQSYGMSADGRFVIFSSNATTLTPTGRSGLFQKDMLTGAIRVISRNSAGNNENGTILAASTSCDGGSIAFMSNANALVSGDTNSRSDVFVATPAWDGDPKLVGLTHMTAGVTPNSVNISCDGTSVIYGLTLTSGGSGHRYNRATGDTTTLPSPFNSSLTQSSDGRYITSGAKILDTKTGVAETVIANSSGAVICGNPAYISANGEFVTYACNNSTNKLVPTQRTSGVDIYTSKTGY